MDGPQIIHLTDEERDTGVMGDKKLYDAIEAFFQDGLVVIENAIDTAIIDKLNDRMLQDTERLVRAGDNEAGKTVYKSVLISCQVVLEEIMNPFGTSNLFFLC